LAYLALKSCIKKTILFVALIPKESRKLQLL
jgi:hypothetical protein